ncbi:hypothetical protein ID80_003271 [Salmonella enterica subsp. enterica serovar Ball]|nr:hypothetical protein [Salmonella enterica subsp. salamae]EDV5022716.1 hypothetical protein [Salmonella enterica subsp. enterica serovar Ball]
MNAFTVTQSYLLLIGSIVLAVFIVRLSMAVGKYRYKRRQLNRYSIDWSEVQIIAHGNVRRSEYQKITTGNYTIKR